jgi:hypothetical protein
MFVCRRWTRAASGMIASEKIVSGLPVASIMSLPVRLLAAGARPIGLGLFYAVFYCGMMVGSGLGGRYALCRHGGCRL